MKVQRADRPRSPGGPEAKGRSDREKSLSGLLSRLDASRKSGLGAGLRAGEMIRRMRLCANLSQKQLGDAIGVAQARISELEAGLGKNGPSFAVLERIAAACGSQLAFLPTSSSPAGLRDLPALIRDERLMLSPIAPLDRETVARQALTGDTMLSSFGAIEIFGSGQLMVPLSGNPNAAGTEPRLVLEPVAITGDATDVRAWYAEHGIDEPQG